MAVDAISCTGCMHGKTLADRGDDSGGHRIKESEPKEDTECTRCYYCSARIIFMPFNIWIHGN